MNIKVSGSAKDFLEVTFLSKPAVRCDVVQNVEMCVQ
jgi:hypothetical protein